MLLVDPVPGVVEPFGQGEHPTASPASSLYVPAPHCWHEPFEPKKPAWHTHAVPPEFSSEDAGQVQLLGLVEPVLTVTPPPGQLEQPSALPTSSLYEPRPHAEHEPPDP